MVPQCSPAWFAKLFTFVREVAQNRGQRVGGIQAWCGGLPGQSWCCYFTTYVLDVCFAGQSPIPRLGAVQSVYNLAKSNNWMTNDPKVDDLFIYVDSNDHAHHIGIVTEDGGGVGVAGNTSADGKSSNGDRVANRPLTKDRSIIKFISYPRV